MWKRHGTSCREWYRAGIDALRRDRHGQAGNNEGKTAKAKHLNENLRLLCKFWPRLSISIDTTHRPGRSGVAPRRLGGSLIG